MVLDSLSHGEVRARPTLRCYLRHSATNVIKVVLDAQLRETKLWRRRARLVRHFCVPGLSWLRGRIQSGGVRIRVVMGFGEAIGLPAVPVSNVGKSDGLTTARGADGQVVLVEDVTVFVLDDDNREVWMGVAGENAQLLESDYVHRSTKGGFGERVCFWVL